MFRKGQKVIFTRDVTEYDLLYGSSDVIIRKGERAVVAQTQDNDYDPSVHVEMPNCKLWYISADWVKLAPTQHSQQQISNIAAFFRFRRELIDKAELEGMHYTVHEFNTKERGHDYYTVIYNNDGTPAHVQFFLWYQRA